MLHYLAIVRSQYYTQFLELFQNRLEQDTATVHSYDRVHFIVNMQGNYNVNGRIGAPHHIQITELSCVRTQYYTQFREPSQKLLA